MNISDIHHDNDLELYKKLHEQNQTTLLQYKNLRHHFDKMVKAVLGEDYYNVGMDVYTCDEITCEDITYEVNKTLIQRILK